MNGSEGGWRNETRQPRPGLLQVRREVLFTLILVAVALGSTVAIDAVRYRMMPHAATMGGE